MLDWALAYAAVEMRVFPVGPDKKPILDVVPHWSADATADEATIRRWWARFPYADIGWAIAPGVVAVDLDEGDGWHGRADFDRLEGIDPSDVTSTPRASTPGGGFHLIYSSNGKDYPNAVKLDAPPGYGRSKLGIDLRVGGKGYVVLSGAGNGRRWCAPLSTPLSPMPSWVMTADRPDDRPTVEPRPFSGEVHIYAATALESACRNIRTAACGEQETTLNSEAYSIGQLVGGGELPEADAIARLTHAGGQMANHKAKPWRAGLIAWKVRRGVHDGMAHPRRRPEPQRPTGPRPQPHFLPQSEGDLAGVAAMECPKGFPVQHWRRFRAGAARFAASDWLATALMLGWTIDELFGLYRPFDLSLQGRAWLIGGGQVIGIASDAIILRAGQRLGRRRQSFEEAA
jgi:hypothetical protein